MSTEVWGPPLGAARVRLLTGRRGRPIALAMLFGYFLALVAAGGHDHWDVFYVADLRPAFVDLRSVTSAWECTRDGVEVLAANPCDPGGRPANYPRLWLLPSWTGAGEETTMALGIATAVVFFGSFFALVGPVGALEGLVYGVALTSPVVMLGVERGNADLIVFAVVVAAIALFRARRGLLRGCAHALLLLAAMLKLFPAFAFALLARQPPRWRLIGGGAVLALFAAYALVTLDDIRTIRKVVPQEIWFSYGAGVGVEAVLGHPSRLVTWIVVATALCAAALVAWRRAYVAGGPATDNRALDAFVAGGAMYVGTFALAHHYDYRLIILLLTLPQLFRWAREGSAPLPLPRVTLGAVLGSLWLSEVFTFEAVDVPLEEVLNWFLFVSFSAALLTLAARAVLRERGQPIAAS